MAIATRSRFESATAFTRALIDEITEHHMLLLSAGVAFYGGLAVVPALIGVVAIYGIVAEADDVEPQLASLTDALPDDARDLVIGQLEAVTEVGSAEITLGLVLSLIGVLWLVSNAMNAVVMGIRIAHERESPHNWVQGRIFALSLAAFAVLSVTAVFWLVLVLPDIISGAEFGSRVDRLVEFGRWPIVVLISATSQAALYRIVIGPRRRGHVLITIGAVSSTVIWVGGTILFSAFAANFGNFQETFGTLGAVAVLLLWLYVSAFAVLFGAEIDGLTDRWLGANSNGDFYA